jgi:hypothetical protein
MNMKLKFNVLAFVVELDQWEFDSGFPGKLVVDIADGVPEEYVFIDDKCWFPNIRIDHLKVLYHAVNKDWLLQCS